MRGEENGEATPTWGAASLLTLSFSYVESLI